MTIEDQATLAKPTTTAATSATEPAVQAAILSGNTGPEVPTEISDRINGVSFGKLALMLAAGVALGYGVRRLWQA